MSARPEMTHADERFVATGHPTTPLQTLKAWARRSRYLARLAELAHERRRSRRFDRHLANTIGAATQWNDAREVRAVAHDELQTLIHSPLARPRKGSPPISHVRADNLATVQNALLNGALNIEARDVTAAAQLASVDPADAGALRLYLACWWLMNERTIRELREMRWERIAMHMTCATRTSRAESSIRSFAQQAPMLGHCKLIGGAAHDRFDRETALLEMSSGDSYECLPQKVFQGLTLLTLACNPRSVLKLDDDHRLGDATALMRLLEIAERSKESLQLGEINRVPLPAAHHRAWHFGKCSDATIGAQSLEMPTPMKWAAGSAGYILNRAALWRVVWSSLYYARWLDHILYEDIALAEIASKTGVRIVAVDMRTAITAVGEY